MHTIEDLVEMVVWKIPALGRRDGETNFAILELLALEGPKTVWDTNKDLGRTRLRYPTIFRAIGRLRKGRYLKRTSSVKMEKKRGRTPKFGITGRGFFAALSSDKVRAELLDVLQRNPQLRLPVPRDVFFDLVGTLWSKQQIEEIAEIIFEKVVETLPFDIESTKDELLISYFFPALMAAMPELENYPPRDPKQLAKYPKVIEFFNNQLDHEIERFQGTLQGLIRSKDWLADLTSHRESGPA